MSYLYVIIKNIIKLQMSKVVFFRAGGEFSNPLRAIYKIGAGEGIGLTFESNPQVIELEQGDIVHGVVEISEQEFQYHLDAWTTLASAFYKGDFNPKTEYRIIFNGEEIIGYSERSQDELWEFLNERRGKGFRVLDEDGETIALIGPEVSAVATYTFWEL